MRRIKYVTIQLSINLQKEEKGDVEKLISNTNKIQKLINWDPKYDNLKYNN